MSFLWSDLINHLNYEPLPRFDPDPTHEMSEDNWLDQMVEDRLCVGFTWNMMQLN